MPAIKATNISKEYKQGRFKPTIKAVDNLSIEVEEGEIFGFLGPNGAGKTTFLKVLLNIIYPTAGSAQLLGIDINKPSARRYVGYLPENPYFNDRMTAYQLLEFYGAFYRMQRSHMEKRRDEVLSITGLTDAAKRPLRSYSKGMLQRIGLSQAILSEPKIVFLDEPSTGLDPMGRRRIKDVILDLKKKGTTVFLNSHILGDVQDTCDRIGIVKNGKLVKVANVKELTIDQHILHIRFGELNDDLFAKIELISNSCKKIEDNVVELALESPENTPDIIERIIGFGGRIFEVRYHERSLEDTFIDIIENEEGA
ncbi:MAG: ABC transporter ATP-binding protein [bacterium]